jgi:hypothetical protein
VSAARPLVLILVSCTLAACATQTIETGAPRTVRTAVGSAPPTTETQSRHGYVEGELILTFTPEGERTVAAVVGQPPNNRLRFGVPSLDRLNAKYRASQLVKVADVQGGYVLRIAPDANVFRAVDEYKKDPLVTGADLHYLMRLPPPQAPEAVRTKTGPLRKEDRPVQPPAR